LSDVPEQLGKYRIRRAIGKGAMGIVYEGFDPVIDRIVAIKTIKKDELDREEAEEHSRRFLIEAKAAGRLNHRNIVGIYDYGEERGLSFIVMEFVQGKELKSFFAVQHPFSMSQIVRLMGELLDALGYSHSRGVVHRDVKPDNIFITEDGSVKLGDFGIARIDSTSRTHAGTVLGTPSYMAPEQIRGETADARSDLYAAGVILYQFLVGERPFSGGMVAVMQKVLMEAPKAPSAHNPSIPEAIDAVVLKALAKAPDARYASAADFNRELAAAVGLTNAEDESESTMIMSAETLKALQEGALLAGDRTGTGTGTGSTGTGATGGTGGSLASRATSSGATGSRAGAIEEARRRADEAKRRYEEDLRKAEDELRAAEEEQQLAEQEAQRRADEWLRSSSVLLGESATQLEAGNALFSQHTLLLAGEQAAAAGRAMADKARLSAQDMAEFTTTSYALTPVAQGELEARQEQLAEAANAQVALAERIEREAAAAQSGLNQKLEVLEKRLAGQDGAWGVESRALEALDPGAGEEPLAAIQARLDKLAGSVDQVGKGFASMQTQTLKLPPPLLERIAVIDAQLQAQAGHVARLRAALDAARARARAALEARRIAAEAAAAEAEARKKAAEELARRKAEEEAARLKAEAEAAKAAEAARLAAEAEEKRLADEEARRQAAEAEERARREAQARAEAEAKRLAEEKAAREAAELAQRRAHEEARQRAELEARQKAEAEARRVAEADAARRAKEEAERQAAAAAESAKRQADDQARLKAEDDARKLAQAEAQRKADGQAKARAEAPRDEAEEGVRRRREPEAKTPAQAAASVGAGDDAEATMISPRASRNAPSEDDGETTMVRPITAAPPAAQAPANAAASARPLPSPSPARGEPGKPGKPVAPDSPPAKARSGLLVPLVGVAAVAIAAGAWFVLRPAPATAVAAVEPAASAPGVVSPGGAPAASEAMAPVPAQAAEAAASAPAIAASTEAVATTPAPAAIPTPGPAASAAADRNAEDLAARKADAGAARRLKAEVDAIRAAQAASAAGKVETVARLDAKPDARPKPEVDTAPPPKAKPADAKADAAETFRKGYAAYLAGQVPEGVRQMEKADAMGAPGARSRLCAIYRKATAAEGKDFLKEATKCQGVY